VQRRLLLHLGKQRAFADVLVRAHLANRRFDHLPVRVRLPARQYRSARHEVEQPLRRLPLTKNDRARLKAQHLKSAGHKLQLVLWQPLEQQHASNL
jgi:hypothetical protein